MDHGGSVVRVGLVRTPAGATVRADTLPWRASAQPDAAGLFSDVRRYLFRRRFDRISG
jgi:hypothetical protein